MRFLNCLTGEEISKEDLMVIAEISNKSVEDLLLAGKVKIIKADKEEVVEEAEVIEEAEVVEEEDLDLTETEVSEEEMARKAYESSVNHFKDSEQLKVLYSDYDSLKEHVALLQDNIVNKEAHAERTEEGYILYITLDEEGVHKLERLLKKDSRKESVCKFTSKVEDTASSLIDVAEDITVPVVNTGATVVTRVATTTVSTVSKTLISSSKILLEESNDLIKSLDKGKEVKELKSAFENFKSTLFALGGGKEKKSSSRIL